MDDRHYCLATKKMYLTKMVPFADIFPLKFVFMFNIKLKIITEIL